MLFGKLAAKGKRSWLTIARRLHQRESNSSTAIFDRLFVLPYDLLELIAIVYFQRREAVKVLCVNSQFHEAFSRAVWRSFPPRYAAFTSIPRAAWENYGHLVRSIKFGYYAKKAGVDATLLPNLVELQLDIRHAHAFNLWSADFPKLRRVYLLSSLDKWTCSNAIICVDVAQKWIRQSGYSLHANWEIDVTTALGQADMESIDSALSKIDADSIAHHTLSLTLSAQHPLILTQLPILADPLIRLDVNRSVFGFDCFFNSNNSNNVVFPRLKILDINNSTLSRSELRQRMSSIAPNWLPSLEELTLRTDSGAPNPSWFACIFEHTWLTLTAVDIQRCYSVVDFQTVISHTPNLSRLSLRECAFSLEVSTLATYTPRLKDLSLGNRLTIDLDSLQHQQHQYRLTALKSLRISHDHDVESDASIPLNAVQFVTRATPILEYICISDFRGIPASDSGGGRTTVNPAVRELRLYAVSYDPDPHNVLDMVRLFPNLNLLDFAGTCSVRDIKNKLRQEYPRLAII